jgi:hypothetical protein
LPTEYEIAVSSQVLRYFTSHFTVAGWPIALKRFKSTQCGYKPEAAVIRRNREPEGSTKQVRGQ